MLWAEIRGPLRDWESFPVSHCSKSLCTIEPIATFDLDIFLILPETKDPILILSPLYKWLENNGYPTFKEQVVIEKIPVQFIPVYNDLIKEAVIEAVEKPYEDVTTRVVNPEYLIAVMLATNRAKDRVRILMMLEEADISEERLLEILKRHGLLPVYHKFLKMHNDV
jgi:hypothetical protein